MILYLVSIPSPFWNIWYIISIYSRFFFSPVANVSISFEKYNLSVLSLSFFPLIQCCLVSITVIGYSGFMTKFANRLSYDLTDSYVCHIEISSRIVERLMFFISEKKDHPFSIRQLFHRKGQSIHLIIVQAHIFLRLRKCVLKSNLRDQILRLGKFLRPNCFPFHFFLFLFLHWFNGYTRPFDPKHLTNAFIVRIRIILLYLCKNPFP